jgi:hypothetical protein
MKINPRLEFWGEIWPNIHIQILATRLILSILKVNEEISSWAFELK